MREVYAKVISRDHARVMEKIGVTETVFPECESALRLGTRISSRSILNFVRLGPDFSVQEMAVPDRWIGCSLRDLQLPRRYRVSVVAIHDVRTEAMISIPDLDAPLKESDTLLVAGRVDALTAVARL